MIQPNVLLSTLQDLRLPLTWIGILYARVKASLAATSGIQQAEDVVKMLMVGASATMMCSVLLREGPEHMRLVEQQLEQWMADHEYESVRQMQGSMSQLRCADPLCVRTGTVHAISKGNTIPAPGRPKVELRPHRLGLWPSTKSPAKPVALSTRVARCPPGGY